MRTTSSIVAAFVVILISLAAISSCGGANPDSTEERSPGELVFRASCQTCHRLPKPESKSADAWPALVARYGERAKLSDEKIAIVTEYLVDASSR